MDKLKFVKIVVFFLTFGIVFLLCLGITKIVKNQTPAGFDISLGLPENAQISHIFTNDNRLYLVTGQNQVHIINLKNGGIDGVIHLSGSISNGKEKEETGEINTN